jgi:hypothetical protein
VGYSAFVFAERSEGYWFFDYIDEHKDSSRRPE